MGIIGKRHIRDYRIVQCPKCKGTGVVHSHGAFGEPESYPCNRCGGLGEVLDG